MADETSETHARHLMSVLVTVMSACGLLVLVAVGALASWLLYKRLTGRHTAYR